MELEFPQGELHNEEKEFERWVAHDVALLFHVACLSLIARSEDAAWEGLKAPLSSAFPSALQEGAGTHTAGARKAKKEAPALEAGDAGSNPRRKTQDQLDAEERWGALPSPVGFRFDQDEEIVKLREDIWRLEKGADGVGASATAPSLDDSELR